jgi:hypothetical protein
MNSLMFQSLEPNNARSIETSLCSGAMAVRRFKDRLGLPTKRRE